jgi:hypothetical protein
LKQLKYNKQYRGRNTEREGTDFISILKDNLHHKPITNIYHFETGDLSLEIQNQYYFDLFADSSAFEQYGEVL